MPLTACRWTWQSLAGGLFPAYFCSYVSLAHDNQWSSEKSFELISTSHCGSDEKMAETALHTTNTAASYVDAIFS
jgi:hypothetical protein